MYKGSGSWAPSWKTCALTNSQGQARPISPLASVLSSGEGSPRNSIRRSIGVLIVSIHDGSGGRVPTFRSNQLGGIMDFRIGTVLFLPLTQVV